MNISSIVINLKDESFLSFVISKIEKNENTEVITEQNDKIVAIISSENLEKQLEIFKSIEMMDGVSSVAMVYNYEELDEETEALKSSQKIADFLNDECDASEIIYGGSINYKVK